MVSIAENIHQVRQRMAAACAQVQRQPEQITLLAVSKTRPAADIRLAHAAGLSAFAENYVQEGLSKIEALIDLRPQLRWHLIGPLQANKTRVVAEQFDWVHTVDRLRIAERLSAQRPVALGPLQVCLQVNISGEDSKSGADPADLPALARAVAGLPGLRLRGLMAIPAPAQGLAPQREPHRRLKGLFEGLRADGLALDTLSMGMSDDLEAAVLEGSTLLRIGTAVFGARGRG